MQKKVLSAIIYFFSLMALLTIVSRVADGATTARVSVTRLGSGPLVHETEKEGRAEADSVIPVWAMEGLRVKEVLKASGDSVSKGEALMYYDESCVQETLESLRTNLKKLEADKNDLVKLEMQADMLIKKRQLDDAKVVLDKARGSKATKEAKQKLARTQEDYDMAKSQWDEKISVEDKKQLALDDEISQTLAKIDKLEKIKKDGCALICDIDAIVVGVSVKSGNLSGSDAAWTLADRTSSLVATVELTAEEAKYVKPQDKASVLPVGQRQWRDAEVLSVSLTAQGMYTASVRLPDKDLTAGQSIRVRFSQKTDSYKQCLPLSAIYGDSAGDYVLIVKDVKSVLGDAQTLTRVSVNVLDKDSSRAAVNGAFSQDDRIVSRSDKAVSAGSRVRINET